MPKIRDLDFFDDLELELLSAEVFDDKLHESILKQEDRIWNNLISGKQSPNVAGGKGMAKRKEAGFPFIPREDAAPDIVKLDTAQSHKTLNDFESELTAKVIGQPKAVAALVDAYGDYLTGFSEPNHPISTLLFLGPTGTGKTRAPIMAAEILCGKDKYIRIDCTEFQYGHEIGKLIGSPPGYIGHRETTPVLTQDKLESFYTPQNKLAFIIFDEIEKANDALWNLLLGILDNATLTLGDNRKVNFEKTIIVLTSNLGAVEINKSLSGSMGFVRENAKSPSAIALNAAKGRFTPEFLNRIDTTVVFEHFSAEDTRKIFELEMRAVQDRIVHSSESRCPIFILNYSDNAATQLIAEGTSKEYNARELKRVIHKQVVKPLRNLILTNQVDTGDTVTIDYENGEFVFLHQYR